MYTEIQDVAPHLLGMFMIALACVPLVFVWQDRGPAAGRASMRHARRVADRSRLRPGR